mmetsp:Transcript_28203/g.68508  ORF Transcript_28203/g.68508 Transcript_28203/m.68508 type:complete len:650 (-) Transcript_28203:110-2059(-)
MDVEAERVDPHAEGALLAVGLGVLLKPHRVLGEARRHVGVAAVEAGEGVEDGGEEAHVELLVALDHVGRLDAELVDAERLGRVEDELRPLLAHRQPADVCEERGDERALLLGRDGSEQRRVDHRVLEVLAEVLHLRVAAGAADLVVDPPQQHLLGGQAEQRAHRLRVVALLRREELDELGRRLEVERRHDPRLDDLPEQAEHEVRRAGHDVARADVHHAAAERHRRVDRQVEVLRHLIDRERALAAQVDAAHVDRVRRRVVDQLAQQHAVLERLEDVERLLVERQQVRAVLVAAERLVHVQRERARLRLGERVRRAHRRADRAHRRLARRLAARRHSHALPAAVPPLRRGEESLGALGVGQPLAHRAARLGGGRHAAHRLLRAQLRAHPRLAAGGGRGEAQLRRVGRRAAQRAQVGQQRRDRRAVEPRRRVEAVVRRHAQRAAAAGVDGEVLEVDEPPARLGVARVRRGERAEHAAEHLAAAQHLAHRPRREGQLERLQVVRGEQHVAQPLPHRALLVAPAGGKLTRLRRRQRLRLRLRLCFRFRLRIRLIIRLRLHLRLCFCIRLRLRLHLRLRRRVRVRRRLRSLPRCTLFTRRARTLRTVTPLGQPIHRCPSRAQVLHLLPSPLRSGWAQHLSRATLPRAPAKQSK